MSSDRELTRIVRSWMEEGVSALPDRVLDDVLAQLPVTPQRRPWWRAWRTHLMNSTLKFAAAGAAVVVAAVVVMALYFNRPAVVPASSPSPGQSPSVTVATPTQPVVVPATDSPLASATHGATPEPVSNAPFVAFLLNVPGTLPPDDLWAIRADGTGAQELVTEFGLPSVAWSQDGTRLLANTEDVNGISHVLIAEVSDVIGPFVDTGFGTGADTACLEKSREPHPCQSSAFSMAPDGERVVFLQSCTYVLPGCNFLTILDLRSGELTELSETLISGRHAGHMALPAWSPDGTKIAFTRETDQGVIGEGGIPESNLYVIDADGQNLRQIALAVPRVIAPHWSPDGTRIALMSDIWLDEGFGSEQNVYVVRPDGTDLRQLTTDGRSSWPEWTLSGQIRFRDANATQTSTAFSLMDADGSNVTPFVDVDALADPIDPPRQVVSNITVPGDPGRTFFWQPSD